MHATLDWFPKSYEKNLLGPPRPCPRRFGRRVFGLTEERARDSAALAANQGLYNGFLAAGLLWSLFAGFPAQLFFLTCVIIAGVFGACTAKRSILWVQAAPAAVALILVVLTYSVKLA